MKPFTALIVDDKISNLISLQALIEDSTDEIKIIAQSNVIEHAFEQIKEKKPDFVFLDIDMPRGGGFDLLQRFPIRKFEVIFVTGYESFKEQAKDFEALDYITKPIDVNEFRKSLEKAIIFRKENPDKVYKSF